MPVVKDIYNWGTATCAARECCVAEIASKLLRKGVPSEAVDALTDRLVSEGFIDHARYARAYASDKFRFERWGRIKIRYSLRHLQIPDELIDGALAEIPEADYREALHQFLESKARTTKARNDYELYQKLVRAALARGFEPECIRRELEQLIKCYDMDD